MGRGQIIKEEYRLPLIPPSELQASFFGINYLEVVWAVIVKARNSLLPPPIPAADTGLLLERTVNHFSYRCRYVVDK